ncbi:flippase [Mangrovimonas sp. TPBH4]|uniref:flippase n=1 Tax=Mangrovimonas sp. TPBH4 TaxID=1645914 RepID=UPI0006B4DE2C|nr:flippase [Mangrovimonas sp. TPBH4]
MEILTKGVSFLILRFGGLLAGYGFTYLIAREYGAGVTGLVSISFTLIMCLSIFGRMGIDVNLIPFYAEKHNISDSGLFFRVLVKAFFVSLVLASILFLLRRNLAIDFFKKPQLEPYILWVSLTIPFWTITLVCAGLFRAFKKNSLFAFFNNPGRFIFSLIAFTTLLIFLKDGLSAIKAHFYGVLLLAIISMVFAVKQFEKPRFVSNTNSWYFLRQAFPMMLSGAIIVFLGWADTFVLGIYETDDTIGIYNVALKIATLTSFSLQAINSILAPKIAAFYKSNQMGEFRKLVKFSTRINFVITLFVVSGIILFNRILLGLFGEEFLMGATVLIVLCFGQLINSISGSVGIIFQMIGKQKVYQNIVTIALIINVALNFALTPKFGGIGAAMATVVSMAFWNIYGAVYLKRNENVVSYFTL